MEDLHTKHKLAPDAVDSKLGTRCEEFVPLSLSASQVLLGEVSAGLSTTQVVVKELKASASVQDQMQFLEEVQPYRSVHGDVTDQAALAVVGS